MSEALGVERPLAFEGPGFPEISMFGIFGASRLLGMWTQIFRSRVSPEL